MAAEVVGSAYVIIRAVTNKLAADIKDGLDKGAADADVDGVGKDIGDRVGKSVADGIDQSGALDSAVAAGQEAGQSLVDGVNKGIDDGDVGKGLVDDVDSVLPDLDKSGEKSGLSWSEGMRRVALAQLAANGPADWFEATEDRDSQRIGFSLRRIFAKAFPDVDESGDSLGKRFSNAFNNGANKDNPLGKFLKAIKIPPIAGLALIALPAIGGALKLVGSYVIGLVGQIGYLATAAGGIGAALAGAGAGLAAGILPILLALKTETPALAEFKESAKSIGGEWKKVGAATQLTLLPALTAAFKTTTTLIPAFSQFGVRIGEAAGNTAKLAASTLTSTSNQGYLNNILNGSVGIWNTLSRVVALVINGILPFLSASQPLAQRLADSVANVAQKFSDVTNAGAASGTLTTTLTTWYDRAELIVRGFGDMLVAIWNTFKIGGDAAAPFFDTFSSFGERWRAFTESTTGQARIKEIFDNALPVVREVNLLLRDIALAIFEPIAGGDTQGVVGFLQTLRKDILPSLQKLSKSLSNNAGPALQSFVDTFIVLLDKLAQSGGLGTFFSSFTLAMKLLIVVLDNPVFGAIVPKIITLITVSKALNLLTFGKFSAGIAGLTKGLSAMVGLTPALGAVKSAVTGFKAAGSLSAGFAAIGTSITAAISPMLIFIGIVVAIVAAIFAIVWAFKNWDKIKEFVAKAWEAVSTFVRELPGKVADAAKALWEWLKTAIPAAVAKAREFFTAVGNVLAELPGKIAGWVSGAAKAIGGFLSTAIPWLIQNVPKFLAKVYKFIYIELPVKIITWAAKAASALFKWIVDALPMIAYWLGFAIGWILGFLVSLPGKIIGFMVKAGAALFKWIVDAIPTVVTWLGKFIGFILGFLIVLPIKILGWLAGAAAALFKWIIDAIPGLLVNLAKFVGFVLGFLVSLPGKIIGWLLPAVGALFGWIIKAIPKVVSGLLGFIGTVLGFIISLPGKILSFIVRAVPPMLSWLADAASQLPGKILTFVNKIKTFATELPGKIIGWIGDIASKMAKVGGDMVKGIWNGIKNLGGWIKDRIKEFAGGVVDGFLKAFKINSPSRLMAKEVGGPIVEGIAYGMTDAYDKWIPDAVTGIANQMAGEFSAIPVALSTPDVAALASIAALTTASTITAGTATVNLQVTIGDRDITDIVDTQITDFQTAYSRQVYARGVTQS